MSKAILVQKAQPFQQLVNNHLSFWLWNLSMLQKVNVEITERTVFHSNVDRVAVLEPAK